MTDRLSQGAFNGPATLEPFADSGVTDTCVLRPVRDVHPLAERFKYVVVASILALLFVCSPAHVSRRVVSVAIDPIECAALWTWTDVCQERWEVVSPFGGHRDSSAPIVGIGLMADLKAPLLSSSPCSILTRSGESVSCVSLNESIVVEAPTTSGVSARQFVGVGDDNLSTAIAATTPCGTPPLVWFTPLDDQTPESLSTKIDKWRHASIVSRNHRSES